MFKHIQIGSIFLILFLAAGCSGSSNPTNSNDDLDATVSTTRTAYPSPFETITAYPMPGNEVPNSYPEPRAETNTADISATLLSVDKNEPVSNIPVLLVKADPAGNKFPDIIDENGAIKSVTDASGNVLIKGVPFGNYFLIIKSSNKNIAVQNTKDDPAPYLLQIVKSGSQSFGNLIVNLR